jgi:tetratricopeptide (TPR) repeat protein
MRTLAFSLLALVGAAMVAVAQPRADATRNQRAVDNALLFVPDGDMLKVAASGYEEPLADLFWVRTVIVFGERYGSAQGTRWVEWVRRMVLAVTTLDPRWRTAYQYGGAFARVSGDIEGSDEIFRRGSENLPDDPWFPFAYGMNAYIYKDDPETAADWIAKAAVRKDAPSWYGAAAAAMRQESGDRAAAIRYLEELREQATSEAQRRDTERQLRRLWHNELVSRWEEACRAFRAEHGRPLADVAEFERVIGPLPANPREDAWIVGGDGVVRSEGADADRVRRLRRGEWRLVSR